MKTVCTLLICVCVFVATAAGTTELKKAVEKPVEKQSSLTNTDNKNNNAAAVRSGGGGYYKPHHSKPKYCYKTICKDYYHCKYVECHCEDIEYVCDCLKYASYYFKSSGYSHRYGKSGGGGGHGYEGHYGFVLKKVCLQYKLCDYSKCKKCKKCDSHTKCYKHKYICGYYH